MSGRNRIDRRWGEIERPMTCVYQRVKLDRAFALQRAHVVPCHPRVAVARVIQHPLQVVRKLDVHGRRVRLLVGAEAQVAARDAAVNRVVGICGAHDAPDGDAHLLGNEAAQRVAERAGGDDEVNVAWYTRAMGRSI